MAAAEAGVMMVSSFVGISGSALSAIGAWAAANPIMAGALVGGIYSGAQTAINGGSISDVLKAAAIGAVTGAIGGAIGGPLGTVAGEVSGAVGGGVAGEVAGAVVHAAAHGVVGGATSLAMGGTFQDGFIGSAIGAGVSSAMGAIPGLDVLEGPGVVKVIGRTAVAAISGGVASVLAGGKFADGAYSAAFFHLFNDEMHRLDRLRKSADENLVVFYDKSDEGGLVFGGVEPTTGRGISEFAGWLINKVGPNGFGDPGGSVYAIDISDTKVGWETKLAQVKANLESHGRNIDRIVVVDHGDKGLQGFGNKVLRAQGTEWATISAAVRPNGRVDLLGCQVGGDSIGLKYLHDMKAYAKSPGITIGAFTGNVSYALRVGYGKWVTNHHEIAK